MSTIKNKEELFDLVKSVKKEKLKKLARSDQATTTFSNRAVCMGEAVKTQKKLGVTQVELVLKNTYYSLLDKYYHNSSAFKTVKVTEKSVSFWRKVAECNNKAGTDPEKYIRAQFAWFHDAFKTTPSLPSLITEAAVSRAQEYTMRGHVTSSAVSVKTEVASVLRQTDEMIRAIMKAQKFSKEEVYKNLVLTGELPIPKVYLDNDPVYQKLRGR